MSFKEIIGHREAVGFLEAAYIGGRLGHAYLFVGPSGVGKGRTARAFAQLLLCEKPQGAESCGVCGSCRKVIVGQHPDLKILEPDGEFVKIDAVREAGRFAGLKSFEGGRKVLIVDPATAMNDEAANALLKTLEEPAAQTILVLTADSTRSLFGTIVSRCQRVIFGALPSKQLEAVLGKSLKAEAAVVRDLSRICDGSPGEALRFHEEGVLERRQALLRFLESDTSVKEAQEWIGDRETALRLLRALALWYRDLLAFKTTCATELLMGPAEPKELERASAHMTTSDILQSLGVVAQTSLDIRRHTSLRLAFEKMRTELCILSHK